MQIAFYTMLGWRVSLPPFMNEESTTQVLMASSRWRWNSKPGFCLCYHAVPITPQNLALQKMVTGRLCSAIFLHFIPSLTSSLIIFFWSLNEVEPFSCVLCTDIYFWDIFSQFYNLFILYDGNYNWEDAISDKIASNANFKLASNFKVYSRMFLIHWILLNT